MKKGPESGTWPLAGVPGKLAESNPDNNRSGGASAKEKVILSSPGELENAQLKPSRETPRKKLCGYLNKLGIKGPIKTWKSRWFVYDENKCHLLYYRTAQDVNPLGSIDLSSASFDCKVENGEGVFEIRTPNRVFTLKVRVSISFRGLVQNVPHQDRHISANIPQREFHFSPQPALLPFGLKLFALFL